MLRNGWQRRPVAHPSPLHAALATGVASTPPLPSGAVLHLLSLACAAYSGYVFLYGLALHADVAGKVRLAAINATLWTASMAAKHISVCQPANTDLWLPIIPGYYFDLQSQPVSEAHFSELWLVLALPL